MLSPTWAQGKFSRFTPEELRVLAERCELRWRMPPFGDDQLPAFRDADERAAYLEVIGAERVRLTDSLHRLHQDLTGEEGSHDVHVLDESLRRHPDGDPIALRARLVSALARGSLDDSGEVYARYLRELSGLSDRFESELGRRVGEERARMLVDSAGTRHSLTGCDTEGALYRSER